MAKDSLFKLPQDELVELVRDTEDIVIGLRAQLRTTQERLDEAHTEISKINQRAFATALDLWETQRRLEKANKICAAQVDRAQDAEARANRIAAKLEAPDQQLLRQLATAEKERDASARALEAERGYCKAATSDYNRVRDYGEALQARADALAEAAEQGHQCGAGAKPDRCPLCQALSAYRSGAPSARVETDECEVAGPGSVARHTPGEAPVSLPQAALGVGGTSPDGARVESPEACPACELGEITGGVTRFHSCRENAWCEDCEQYVCEHHLRAPPGAPVRTAEPGRTSSKSTYKMCETAEAQGDAAERLARDLEKFVQETREHADWLKARETLDDVERAENVEAAESYQEDAEEIAEILAAFRSGSGATEPAAAVCGAEHRRFAGHTCVLPKGHSGWCSTASPPGATAPPTDLAPISPESSGTNVNHAPPRGAQEGGTSIAPPVAPDETCGAGHAYHPELTCILPKDHIGWHSCAPKGAAWNQKDALPPWNVGLGPYSMAKVAELTRNARATAFYSILDRLDAGRVTVGPDKLSPEEAEIAIYEHVQDLEDRARTAALEEVIDLVKHSNLGSDARRNLVARIRALATGGAAPAPETREGE